MNTLTEILDICNFFRVNPKNVTLMRVAGALLRSEIIFFNTTMVIQPSLITISWIDQNNFTCEMTIYKPLTSHEIEVNCVMKKNFTINIEEEQEMPF